MESPKFLEKFGTGRWVGIMYVLDKCPLCNGAQTMRFTGKGLWGCSKCSKGGKDLESFRQHLASNPMLESYLNFVTDPVPPKSAIVLSKYVNQYSEAAIPTGFSALDQLIGGLREATLTIFTGKSGHGKSTILGTVALNAIQGGHNVCFYSGELSAGGFQDWLFAQAAGAKYMEAHLDQFGATRWTASVKVQEAIRKWWGESLTLYDNTDLNSSDKGTILRTFRDCRAYYGSDLFIVDNLMTARNDQDGADDALRAEANFTAELLNFARENQVAVILVAHPRKGETEDIKEGVSGLANITNLASNVIRIKRCNDTEAGFYGCETLLTVGKNRSYGDEGSIRFSFEQKSRRFIPLDGNAVSSYGWTKFLDK